MATVNFSDLGSQRENVKTIAWTGIVGADTITPYEFDAYPDKTVQVNGPTFVSAVAILGSNDGTNWFTLTDNQGIPLSFSAAGMKLIAENPRYIKPDVPAGASVNSVYITGKKY